MLDLLQQAQNQNTHILNQPSETSRSVQNAPQQSHTDASPMSGLVAALSNPAFLKANLVPLFQQLQSVLFQAVAALPDVRDINLRNQLEHETDKFREALRKLATEANLGQDISSSTRNLLVESLTRMLDILQQAQNQNNQPSETS